MRVPIEQEVERGREDDLGVLEGCEVKSVHRPVVRRVCRDNQSVSHRQVNNLAIKPLIHLHNDLCKTKMYLKCLQLIPDIKVD